MPSQRRPRNLYVWVCDGLAIGLSLYGIIYAIVAHAHR